MDPFSAEGELAPIHNAFHTGQYASVVAADTASLSPENKLPARVLQLRSRIALGEASAVASELEGEADTDLTAVRLYALIAAGADEETAAADAELHELITTQGDNLTVQLLGATVLARGGNVADALALLARHQGSLDAVALIAQLHLAQNRLDLAQAAVRNARAWAQDSLLVNLAESWVGLRAGGAEAYQAAFYVYEELATAPPQAPTDDAAAPLVAQALCELHLGRLPEAEAAIGTALARDPPGPAHAHALAAGVPLYALLGRGGDAAACRVQLQALQPGHPLVEGLQRREEAFDAAAARYKPVLTLAGEAA